MTTSLTALVLGLALSVAAACNTSNAAPAGRAEGTSSAALFTPARPTATKVTKIVFVGKQNVCECTRKTLDASWAALQKALGTPPKLPVERLQIDTQGDKVASYRQQKPFAALPAIYFVDAKDLVLDLLQGEVTDRQIGDALSRL